MNWAVNELKYQRAFSKSESKEESDVRRIYVEMGGLIKKGYEVPEATLKIAVAVEEVKEWVGSTGTSDEKKEEIMNEINKEYSESYPEKERSNPIVKRVRKAKNAK